MLAMRRDPLSFLLALARTYGDIAFFHAGPFDIYLLSHPDHIHDVLVTHHHSFMKSQVLQEAKRVLGEGLLTSEGDVHRRQRRLIQPVFHHARVAGYADIMAEHGARVRDRWLDGQVLDIHAEMMRLTMAVVGKSLFGADLQEAAAQEVARSLNVAFEMYNRFLLPFAAVLELLPLPSNRRFQEARKTLDSTIYRMIRERRKEGDRGDLLSMLLSARDEKFGQEDGGMSDEQVRDEAMTIFLAGHETMANALTWTSYLLSQHPEVEVRLCEEVDSALEGNLPTADDLPKLEYTRRVLSESLRLYPPAWAMGRRLLADVEVGGFPVPAGSTTVMSQYIVHHDPRWYPDPFRFDPERWKPERLAERPRFSYFPFGGGPRMCIGEDFAWMEGITLIAVLAQRWQLRLAPGQTVALQPRITLRPRYGMKMTVHRRG
jgi:cytochrome P450